MKELKSRVYTAKLFALCPAFSVGVVAISIGLFGNNVVGWHQAVLWTVRFSLSIFLIVFVSGPLSRMPHPAFVSTILRERRGLGLGFFGAHTVHVAAVLIYFWMGGDFPKSVAITGDIIGYVTLTAMALTSNDYAVRKIGPKRWKILHTFGIYYIWTIFFFVYAARAGLDLKGLLFGAVLVLLVSSIILRLSCLRPKSRHPVADQ